MIEAKLEALDTIIAQEERRMKTYMEQLKAQQGLIKDKQAMIKLCELCLQEQVAVIEDIAGMVNAFLSAFDDDLEFKCETAYKADKITVAGVKPVITNANNNNRPSEGQRTVASLGLLIAFIKLKEISQVVIFDEYLADVAPNVTQDLIDIAGQLLDQVIVVTHQDITAPVTYKVTKRNKISEVEKL